ncbi:hypothetical protein EMIHUDRAFT_453703 [Emiliania huxleyi CCMP1516]|uniref:AB hydrolase-1 domain-containing protein n=2 Tax=Emiliania huxleyi TaxID=2903 RepID=A0A0D3I1N6_EMIH1|nr:hypothetical protein EMIHUDRAFT_453703 [Emiliania huxleyi CCMP1516]EOD05171.1 hypothetical protein EMIHUDRAFT_453703 [Emiliania huxleyi CCMP1516]|eukprot:XP_005757600.1 hypothetical protein EMIHUDRAFT_453703 [Emiliania huxleyi CCMP1516]
MMAVICNAITASSVLSIVALVLSIENNPPGFKFGPLPDKWVQEGVKPFPYIYCYRAFDIRVINEVKAAYLAAGLNSQWESAWEKLQSVPSFVGVFADPGVTKVYAELENAAQSECRRRPEYHLGTNLARGTMVYQDFMGTQDLAHDLDTLRTAIGADKLSVWGISYGTEVGATYATVYPERVDKMILDGNVAISNEIYEAAHLWALSYEQVWNGLAAACNNDFFVAGGIDAPTLPADDFCAATPYPTDKMYKLLGAQTDETLLLMAFTLLSKFFEGGGIMHSGVSPGGAIMMACVESLHKYGNFDGEGCCDYQPKSQCCKGKIQIPANNNTFKKEDDENPTITLVRSVDMAGRLSTADTERLWADLKDKHPIGFLRAGNIVSIVSAPNLPRPVPSYGSGLDKLQPLIIGDFHDPATTYTASQDMRDKFPNGALMSWQGYHHGLFLDDNFGLSDYTSNTFQNEGYGAKDCYDRMLSYLEDGKLPPNGYTCPINGPAAGSLSLKVAKQGHQAKNGQE